MNQILTLDFGGSAVKYALISHEGNILHKGKKPAPTENLESFINVIISLYEKYKTQINGVGISMPGRIDPNNGFAYTGGAYTFIKNIPLEETLKEHIHVPIFICNDAKCASYAELALGSLKGVSTGVVVVLGTGIGGGVIVNNQVLQGLNFSAGEFSSILTNGKNYKDPKGSWYATNGISGLLEEVQKELKSNEKFSGEEIFEMANNKIEAVIRAIDNFSAQIATQIYNFQVILDPEKIVIGGGISAQPLLFDLINKHLDVLEQIGKEQNLPIKRPIVKPCQFLNDANLIGAFVQVRDKIKNTK